MVRYSIPFIAAVAAFVALLSGQILAQDATYDELESRLALEQTQGSSPQVIGGLAAAWLEGRQISELPLPERIRLSNFLHVEQLPVQAFSARWTGFLAPSTSGDYTFEPLRQHHVDGTLRITLGGNLVLDSSTDAVAVGDGSTRMRVRSKPVMLNANESVPIVVDYVFDAEAMLQDREFDERIFPMVVVTWQRGSGPAEIIPPDVFRTPDRSQQGLLGSYYAGVGFGQLVLSRVDPGLQMIWSEKQVASTYADVQSKVVASCLEAINAANAFASIEDKAKFIEADLPKLLKRLPARDRAEILRKLTAQPDMLAAASPFGVRSLFPHLFMLPQETISDFFLEWVTKFDVTPAQILRYPGWGPESFIGSTYDDYGWVGHFLRGANWPIAQELLDTRLANEDGSCNLMVAYCVGMAAIADRRGDAMERILEEVLGDDSLTGDKRATWLLARGFFEEVCGPGIPRPVRGMPYLDEASLVAESPEMSFRVLQEIVARLASLDEGELALKQLERAETIYPTHADEIAGWRVKVRELSNFYGTIRND